MFKKHLKSVFLSALLAMQSVPVFAYDAEINALLLESSNLMQTGRVDEALILLKAGEAKYSKSREFMNNLAIAYLGNSQPDNALSILRQLVETDPMYSIITHNLLEMELQINDAREDKIKPVLFVQTVESFFDEELQQVNSQPPTNDSRPTSQEILPPLTPRDSEPVVSTDRRLLAQDLVTLWASHWSSKDYLHYIDMYSEHFVGANGESYEQWANTRHSRLNKSGSIAVRLSNIKVENRGDNELRVTFDQRYTSNNYSDLVLKELILINENSTWKIVRETTLATY